MVELFIIKAFNNCFNPITANPDVENKFTGKLGLLLKEDFRDL